MTLSRVLLLTLTFTAISVACAGCGGSTSGPVEVAPMSQTPTSELPEGAEPELPEEGP
jgi:hypothetical protein